MLNFVIRRLAQIPLVMFVLSVLVIGLTAFQFRYIERRVHYG